MFMYLLYAIYFAPNKISLLALAKDWQNCFNPSWTWTARNFPLVSQATSTQLRKSLIQVFLKIFTSSIK